MHRAKNRLFTVGVFAAYGMSASWAIAQPRDASIRAGHGQSIISVRNNHRTASEGTVAGVTWPYPQPRLAGFSPLVAITTSDKRRPAFEDTYEHTLESTYSGNPIHLFPEAPYIIGFLDSGAVVDLTSDFYGFVLGLTGEYLTENTIPIGGVGDTVLGFVTQPVGYFAAGLSAIETTNFELDFAALKGHSNVAAVVGPDLACGNGEELTAIVGTPLMSYFTSVIRVDTPRRVLYDERYFLSPDVQILDRGAPFPAFPRKIGMELTSTEGNPVLAAGYYPDFDDLETPGFPTMLSVLPGFIPTGGAYFSLVHLRQGPADPKNPLVSTRFMVDTGAQSSIISELVAANLGIPLDQPHFTVDICGVGGLVENVPGFYVDFVQIPSSSVTPFRFSRAPFIVLNLPSPEGGTLDGILGMNFFWNRNIVFETTLVPFDPNNPPSGDEVSFLHVSDPVSFAAPDFDLDLHVDSPDTNILRSCFTGPVSALVGPECTHTDLNGDGDVDLGDFAVLQNCFSSLNLADTTCGH